MATVGTGYRTANSLLAEISLHLLEPLVRTQIPVPVVPGVQSVLVLNTTNIYIGALLVVDLGSPNQEIVQVTAVTATNFTANFANAHGPNAIIITPTFPTQAPTDPFFTQSEMLGYLARAQNEFLAKVPFIFQLFQQNITFGQIYQTTPLTCIEIDRVALSNPNVIITSLTRTGSVVTAITASPHGLNDSTNGATPSKFAVLGTGSTLSDPTFIGVFQVSTVVNATTFQYVQNLPNSTSTGGFIGLWTRLYEISQEELTMAHRGWQVETKLVPTNWFEDRAGNYRWGIGNNPLASFPVELLCSVRDSDTLLLTDGFLVPDLFLHYVKYKALEYAWTKDGEQKNSQMADYAKQRFESGVMATKRWLDGLNASAGMQGTRG